MGYQIALLEYFQCYNSKSCENLLSVSDHSTVVLRSCDGEQMQSVVVYDLYAVCTHTSGSFLCDQKGSRPDGAFDVHGVRRYRIGRPCDRAS